MTSTSARNWWLEVKMPGGWQFLLGSLGIRSYATGRFDQATSYYPSRPARLVQGGDPPKIVEEHGGNSRPTPGGEPRNPTVEDMVAAQLEAQCFDGLYSPGGACACLIGDLAPCGEIGGDCTAGYRVDFPNGCDSEEEHARAAFDCVEGCGAGGGCDWHIEARRRTPKD